MIITRAWIQEFIDISKISTDDICKTLNSIGLEVDNVKKIKIPDNVKNTQMLISYLFAKLI